MHTMYKEIEFIASTVSVQAICAKHVFLHFFFWVDWVNICILCKCRVSLLNNFVSY